MPVGRADSACKSRGQSAALAGYSGLQTSPDTVWVSLQRCRGAQAAVGELGAVAPAASPCKRLRASAAHNDKAGCQRRRPGLTGGQHLVGRGAPAGRPALAEREALE